MEYQYPVRPKIFENVKRKFMEKPSSRSLFLWWPIVAALIIAIDQITKFWIIENFQLGQWMPVTDFFNIVRAHNTGAAFSFLANASGWQKWFFVGVGFFAIIFIIWQIKKYPYQKTYCASLTILGGGAVGNVIDRLIHGYVVDFLDFHWWGGAHFPAFNVADMAISVGAILLIVDEILRARREKSQHSS